MSWFSIYHTWWSSTLKCKCMFRINIRIMPVSPLRGYNVLPVQYPMNSTELLLTWSQYWKNSSDNLLTRLNARKIILLNVAFGKNINQMSPWLYCTSISVCLLKLKSPDLSYGEFRRIRVHVNATQTVSNVKEHWRHASLELKHIPIKKDIVHIFQCASFSSHAFIA